MAYLRWSNSRFYVYWCTDEYGDTHQVMIDNGDQNARVSYDLCKSKPNEVVAMFADTAEERSELHRALRSFIWDIDHR